MKLVPCVCALCLAVLHSCNDKTEEQLPETNMSTRTVLVYMVAENSLNSYTTSDIEEMLEGAGQMPDKSKIVVYLDDIREPRIYTITHKTKERTFSALQPSYRFGSELNSASANTLKDVLKYVRTEHPSDSYGIVFWSHASGWIESSFAGDQTSAAARKSPIRKSFGIDNGKNTTSNNGSQMNIKDMASALSEFPTFDFIMFDACFMQSVETLFELKDCARYIIGSPAEIPAPGAPYDKLIVPMFAEKIAADGMINSYYNSYCNDNTYGIVISAVDCSKLDHLAQLTSLYVKEHKEDMLRADLSDVQNYFIYDEWNVKADFPDYYDMQGIMLNTLSPGEYQQWKAAFDEAVTTTRATDYWYSAYERGRLPIDKEQCGGVSMFLPLDKYADENFAEQYFSTQWAGVIGAENGRNDMRQETE